MTDLILVLGTPGSGKTTIAKLLKNKLGSVHINYDKIRNMHLKDDWSNASDDERSMAFANLVFLLRNYLRHGYKNIIVDGPREYNVKKLAGKFKNYNFKVISLIVEDDKVLARRVMDETRDSKWRNVEESRLYNARLKNRLTFEHEVKIDNTNRDPEEVIEEIIKKLESEN